MTYLVLFFQCRKASDLLSFQEILWQNKIPMRIDVLLFPNCEHGYLEETIIEGASFSCMDNFELLERWDIQMVKKRYDGGVLIMFTYIIREFFGSESF